MPELRRPRLGGRSSSDYRQHSKGLTLHDFWCRCSASTHHCLHTFIGIFIFECDDVTGCRRTALSTNRTVDALPGASTWVLAAVFVVFTTAGGWSAFRHLWKWATDLDLLFVFCFRNFLRFFFLFCVFFFLFFIFLFTRGAPETKPKLLH